ncbi:DUF934 domain-containing protein [Sphaerotilus natans]|uniref:DUF934 domain-containing protein n=1 Tax=Sphaerotilus natans TaxID=34103 RepID=UPI00406D1C03
MKFIDIAHDPWHTVGGEDGPIPHPQPKDHLLLTLEQWHAVRETWPAGLAVGVILPNSVDVETLAADLPRLSLVALQFPKWVDGRAYTQARLLRVRYRFQGQIRATGEALVDMLPLMQRTGFDAVALRRDQSREAAERALGFFAGHYQGAVGEARPVFARPADAASAGFVNAGAAI